MARPVGVTARVKDNSRKKFKEHDEWMEGKKIGRPKQVWVPEHMQEVDLPSSYGGSFTTVAFKVKAHWEKV